MTSPQRVNHANRECGKGRIPARALEEILGRVLILLTVLAVPFHRCSPREGAGCADSADQARPV